MSLLAKTAQTTSLWVQTARSSPLTKQRTATKSRSQGKLSSLKRDSSASPRSTTAPQPSQKTTSSLTTIVCLLALNSTSQNPFHSTAQTSPTTLQQISCLCSPESQKALSPMTTAHTTISHLSQKVSASHCPLSPAQSPKEKSPLRTLWQLMQWIAPTTVRRQWTSTSPSKIVFTAQMTMQGTYVFQSQQTLQAQPLAQKTSPLTRSQWQVATTRQVSLQTSYKHTQTLTLKFQGQRLN